MSRSFTRLLLLAAPILSTACGSIPTKEFQFDAIDVEEQPVPVMVVLDNDWAGARQNKQFVNVGNRDDTRSIKLTFQHPEVTVTVAPVQVDRESGDVIHVPTSRDDAREYLVDPPRNLRATDPRKQLFIMQRR